MNNDKKWIVNEKVYSNSKLTFSKTDKDKYTLKTISFDIECNSEGIKTIYNFFENKTNWAYKNLRVVKKENYRQIDIKLFENYFDTQFKTAEELKENMPKCTFNLDEINNIVSNIYQTIIHKLMVNE